MEDHQIKKLVFPVILVFLIGTAGFSLIEHWNLVDSFYMTVITLTTVGYGEVHPLSQDGKVFVSLLILCGVGVATYSFSSLMGFIVEGEIFRTRQRKKMNNEISNLRNHAILCGHGRLGKMVLKQLQATGHSVVVIENHQGQFDILEKDGQYAVYGSAYEDEVLKKAGIERAGVLLSLLTKDADNVYVTLCARDLNPNIKIIARTEDESGVSRLKRAGANDVISPYRLSGNRIVQKVVRPHVSNFLEITGTEGGSQLGIEQVIIPSNSKLVGCTLEKAALGQRYGAIVAAIVSADGSMVVGPSGKDSIDEGSTLIILGEKSSLEKVAEAL